MAVSWGIRRQTSGAEINQLCNQALQSGSWGSNNVEMLYSSAKFQFCYSAVGFMNTRDFPWTSVIIIYQNMNDELNWEHFEFVFAGRGFFAKHSPVLHGQRWSVNSSAWRWRRRCVLCWTRWHQTCSPASVDFAPKDRYLTPPSTCQPGVQKNTLVTLFSMYLKMSVCMSIKLLDTYHFFGNVANWNLIIRWDVLLLGGNKQKDRQRGDLKDTCRADACIIRLQKQKCDSDICFVWRFYPLPAPPASSPTTTACSHHQLWVS